MSEIVHREARLWVSTKRLDALLAFAIDVARRTATPEAHADVEALATLAEATYPGFVLDIERDLPSIEARKLWCRVFHDVAAGIVRGELGDARRHAWRAATIHDAVRVARLLEACVREDEPNWQPDTRDRSEADAETDASLREAFEGLAADAWNDEVPALLLARAAASPTTRRVLGSRLTEGVAATVKALRAAGVGPRTADAALRDEDFLAWATDRDLDLDHGRDLHLDADAEAPGAASGEAHRSELVARARDARDSAAAPRRADSREGSGRGRGVGPLILVLAGGGVLLVTVTAWPSTTMSLLSGLAESVAVGLVLGVLGWGLLTTAARIGRAATRSRAPSAPRVAAAGIVLMAVLLGAHRATAGGFVAVVLACVLATLAAAALTPRWALVLGSLVAACATASIAIWAPPPFDAPPWAWLASFLLLALSATLLVGLPAALARRHARESRTSTPRPLGR